jgi:hypothetical protein
MNNIQYRILDEGYDLLFQRIKVLKDFKLYLLNSKELNNVDPNDLYTPFDIDVYKFKSNYYFKVVLDDKISDSKILSALITCSTTDHLSKDIPEWDFSRLIKLIWIPSSCFEGNLNKLPAPSRQITNLFKEGTNILRFEEDFCFNFLTEINLSTRIESDLSFLYGNKT